MKERVLITGASGYVGARLYHDLKPRYEVTGTYHNTQLSADFVQLDTTNRQSVQELFRKLKPTVVIHAAANASGKWVEEHPEEAIELNQNATRYVARAAREGFGTKVILISSFAAEDENSLYGNTKRASEEIVKRLTDYVIIRPSLVVGFSPNTQNDRPFNRFLKNLDEGTEAVYDTSWKFQPTYIGHLSEVIDEVIQDDISRRIVPVAVSQLKSRFELAKDILGPFGISVIGEDLHDQTPVITSNLKALETLDLSRYDYEDVITEIVNEIRNRESFKPD